MKNITGNKLLGHIQRVAGDYRPITADVFLTNYCNNACPYCTYRRWELDKDARSMSYDEFVRYAERLVQLGVKGIILTGGGEPTLCRDFDRITDYLEQAGIDYGINTNFNTLKMFKPKYLKVSLDGYDRDSYLMARGVDKYEQTVENIKQYAIWKKCNSPSTSLGIQWVANEPDGVKKFYEANKDLDVDYISFRPLESTDGSCYSVQERKSQAQAIIRIINELAAQDSRVALNFKWNLLDQRMEKCYANWAQIAINERGDVMYCCHKPYQIVGHILDDDILEKKAKAGTDMRKCDVPCRMTAPNMLMQNVSLPQKDANFL